MGWLAQETAEPGGGSWSVSELNAYIKELFDVDFRLRDVSVSGEISNFTRARSGHLYFTLKDDSAQVRCVMWKSAAARLVFDPRDGDAVVANGRISVYEAGGAYQLYAERLTPAGRGDLAQAFELLKQRLAAEGLFDPAHKKPIPQFPEKIGIVTSANAAALRDILNVLRRRYPLVRVLVAPTLVQGAEAPAQIVRALRWLDGRDDVDTIIVSRGGGSIEDLWAFNDEQVARAIHAARHPVIAGVGHEIDTTIADYVADLRAPTPSAAAELAVPDMGELRLGIGGLRQLLESGLAMELRERQTRVTDLARTLALLGPAGRLDGLRQRLDGFSLRLEAAIDRGLERRAGSVALLKGRMAGVSPLATLARGYAIVRSEQGRVIRGSDEVAGGQALTVQVHRGRFGVTVTPLSGDSGGEKNNEQGQVQS